MWIFRRLSTDMAGNGCEDATREKLWCSSIVFNDLLESVDGLNSNTKEKSGGGFVMWWLLDWI